jgi:hypothetical protein
VMDAVGECLRGATAEFFRSICRCSYLSN